MIFKVIAVTEVKAAPSKFSETLKFLPENRLLLIKDIKNGWAKTQLGYVAEDDLEFAFTDDDFE